MKRSTRYLFLALVGGHLLVWVLVYALRPAEGGIDQSPAFLFLVHPRFA